MLALSKLFVATALAIVLAIGPARAEVSVIRVGGTGAALGVFKILARDYEARRPGAEVQILPSLGSSGGIAAVSSGVISIAVSARPLNAQEREKGLADRLWARSPFAFVTSRTAPTTLRREDVIAIFSGGLTAWPDGSPLRIILRPRGETTYQALVHAFPALQDGLETARRRKEIPIAATDQDNVELAERIGGSVTVATLMQVVTERPRIWTIPLDGVEPTVENLASGAYTFAAEFYLVAPASPSADAASFLGYLAGADAARVVTANGGAMSRATPR